MTESLSVFRNRGEQMLKRWGIEIEQGEGKPNILAMIDHIPETGNGVFSPQVGAMFSPQAEKCDKMLHDIARIDRVAAEYLTAYALGLSLSDMMRSLNISSRSKANIELERSLSYWTMMVYFRAKGA